MIRIIQSKAILRNTSKLLVVFISLLLICTMLVTVSLLWSDNTVAKEQLQSVSTIYSNNSGNISSYSESSIPDLFDKVKHSVVKVTPSSGSANLSLSGSGFVYDKQGHILTNSHVAGTASSVVITFIDGNQYDAIVVGKDPVNDIAILRISENHTGLVPVQFGNSSAVRVGERAIAIGNPYGFANTLTGGFISQVGRLLLETGSEAPYPHPNMIQTDAIINPGNSGGPLINLQGQVIGMNTATITSELGGATGLGFSIPSKTLLRETPVLIENGSYPHPWLGISARTLTTDLNREFGLDSNFRGVLVDSLVEDGPADMAENRGKALQGGIITALDGHPIRNTNELLSYIEDNKLVGDKIIIMWYKNNQTNDFLITLGERPLLLYTSQNITAQTPLY
jgi:S1-C subfamily serine protease